MLSSIKLLADENVSSKLVKFLSEKGIDIKYASKGLKNSALFSLGCKEGMTIVTHDTDFINPVLYPPSSCHGIIVLAIHPMEIEKMKSSLIGFLKDFSGDTKGKLFIVRDKEVEVIE